MFQEQGELKVQQVEGKTRNSEYLLPCSMPYLLSHRNPTLTVSQQITLNCPEDRLMSYKVLSLHTRNKIVQFCHEAFQQRHCSLNINLCCYLAPTAWRPRHLHPSTSTAEPGNHKPSRINLCFPPARDMGTNYKTIFKSHSKRGVTESQGLWQVSK